MTELMKFILKTNYRQYLNYRKVSTIGEYIDSFYSEAAELVLQVMIENQYRVHQILNFANKVIEELSLAAEEEEEA